MPSFSMGVGVGGPLPKPKSGSIQRIVIVTNWLTPVVTLLLSHVGEKLVAQSALPSKCEATFVLVRSWMSSPFLSLLCRSPSPKAPNVYRTLLPSGAQTQFSSPSELVAKGVAPVPSTLTVQRSAPSPWGPRRKQSRVPSGETDGCQSSLAGVASTRTPVTVPPGST